MPIDSSLYAQIQSPDFLGSYNKGLEIADKMRERKAANADAEKKLALQSAYNAGLTQNSDGSVTHDESKTLKYLADNGLGQEYLASKKQFGDLAAEKQKQQAEVEKRNLDYTGQAIGAAKANPQAWPQIRADYITKTGADPATIPEQYDPKYIAQTENSLLTVAQRQGQANADREFTLKERELALKARELANSKSDKKYEKEQGLMTPYGLANTIDDAKQLKSADEEKKVFDSKIDEMIALRTKHSGGATLNREDVARAQQLSKDALLAYKNMAKLGVLSQSDENIINAIIPPDPLAYNSMVASVQGQDPILNNLKRFKKDSDNDFANRLNNRLRGGNKSASKEVDITPEEAMAELQLRKQNAANSKGGNGG